MPEPDHDNPVPGTDGRTIECQCYHCYAYGHISSFCPQCAGRSGRTSSNVQALQVGISLTQSNDNAVMVDPYWILLDICSTNRVISNVGLVKNVRDCKPDDVLKIHTNGGVQTFHQIGDLKFLPLTVHVNPASMANILSLKEVANLDGVRVTLWIPWSRSPSQCILGLALHTFFTKEGMVCISLILVALVTILETHLLITHSFLWWLRTKTLLQNPKSKEQMLLLLCSPL